MSDDVQKMFDQVEFLSPNEPLTQNGVERVLDQMQKLTATLDVDTQDLDSHHITLWDKNVVYKKGQVVVYFKQERKQTSSEQGLREFVFLLMSGKDNNTNIPNYDLADGVPDFSKSNWIALNPTSYLLQDLNELRSLVVDKVFKQLMARHMEDDHGVVGEQAIEASLVKLDYSNLQTPWRGGKNSVVNYDNEVDGMRVQRRTNGVMEIDVEYGFDAKANRMDNDGVKILDRRNYRMKSPIWNESDQTIFAQRYGEDDLFSVVLNKDLTSGNVLKYINLRHGTNIFFKDIEFPEAFANDEYMVFFDTYARGQFVFGYDAADLESKTEPTYDAIVSMPMLMNKGVKGFTVVLPVHTYFNSMQKYNVGVPCKNQFRLHAIGRYR